MRKERGHGHEVGCARAQAVGRACVCGLRAALTRRLRSGRRAAAAKLRVVVAAQPKLRSCSRAQRS